MNAQTRSPNPNRLAAEKSPYLLQHADNPVDWYPWGDEAFEKARREDKPVLVSIGYSTCHWCHVMADESFSDPETAELMNRHFVNIKVDREERPDIDQIYITAVSAMTGSAGWPLNVFLTPSGKPFFGGTYFPPKRRVNPSWKEILSAVAAAYSDPQKKKELLHSAERFAEAIRQHLSADDPVREGTTLKADWLDAGVDAFSGAYDRVHGGFSGAPKFPMPPLLDFLLFYHRYAQHVDQSAPGSRSALEMVIDTLEKMADGGIYDHLGGGFHRYATDEAWHVPHFEKMLYDNAQLIRTYLDAFAITGNDRFAETARETLEYVLREMTHPAGGFYSAEDADSVYMDLSAVAAGGGSAAEKEKKKSEGGFYVWRKAEIDTILSDDNSHGRIGEVFSFCYGVRSEGNAVHDPLGEFGGKNILFREKSAADAARHLDMEETEAARLLAMAKKRLLEARGNRPRPHLDDKILVEWNGLMISALAAASRVLGDSRYLDAAEAAVSFIFDRMYEDGDQPALYRRWRDGEAKIPAMAADYAFLIQGLLDVYEAGFNPRHLERAIALSSILRDRFFDSASGGFYTVADGQDAHLLVKARDRTDGVMPSTDAVAAMNFLRLYRLTGNTGFGEAVDRTLDASAPRMERQPAAVPAMLSVLGTSLLRHAEIVVVGSPEADEGKAVLSAIRSRMREAIRPVWIDKPETAAALAPHLPHLAGMGDPRADGVQVFACFGNTCREPVHESGELSEILDSVFSQPQETVYGT